MKTSELEKYQLALDFVLGTLKITRGQIAAELGVSELLLDNWIAGNFSLTNIKHKRLLRLADVIREVQTILKNKGNNSQVTLSMLADSRVHYEWLGLAVDKEDEDDSSISLMGWICAAPTRSNWRPIVRRAIKEYLMGDYTGK